MVISSGLCLLRVILILDTGWAWCLNRIVMGWSQVHQERLHRILVHGTPMRSFIRFSRPLHCLYWIGHHQIVTRLGLIPTVLLIWQEILHGLEYQVISHGVQEPLGFGGNPRHMSLVLKLVDGPMTVSNIIETLTVTSFPPVYQIYLQLILRAINLSWMTTPTTN